MNGSINDLKPFFRRKLLDLFQNFSLGHESPPLRCGILRFDQNFEAKYGGGGNRTRVTPKIHLILLHFFIEKSKCKSFVKVS